jgi:hypothetical protein
MIPPLFSDDQKWRTFFLIKICNVIHLLWSEMKKGNGIQKRKTISKEEKSAIKVDFMGKLI